MKNHESIKGDETLPSTLAPIESYMRSHYKLFTIEEWKAYKRSALVVLLVFGLANFGAAILAARAVVANTAAAEATRRIQATEQDALEAARQIQRTLASLKDSDNLARISERVTVQPNNVISIKFPNDNGRFQIEEGGKILWYPQPVGGGDWHQIYDNFH